MRIFINGLLLTLYTSTAFSSSATYTNNTQFELTRKSDDFIIDANSQVVSSIDNAWKILTDYNHLNNFIPNMTSSAITKEGIENNEPYKEVTQQGKVDVLFFASHFEITLRVTEKTPTQIDMHFLSGDMKYFDARYTLTAIDSTHTHIAYHAHFKPDQFVPPWIGTLILRNQAREQFEAVLSQIEHQSAQKP